jgi:hypothetical protein
MPLVRLVSDAVLHRTVDVSIAWREQMHDGPISDMDKEYPSLSEGIR